MSGKILVEFHRSHILVSAMQIGLFSRCECQNGKLVYLVQCEMSQAISLAARNKHLSYF